MTVVVQDSHGFGSHGNPRATIRAILTMYQALSPSDRSQLTTSLYSAKFSPQIPAMPMPFELLDPDMPDAEWENVMRGLMHLIGINMVSQEAGSPISLGGDIPADYAASHAVSGYLQDSEGDMFTGGPVKPILRGLSKVGKMIPGVSTAITAVELADVVSTPSKKFLKKLPNNKAKRGKPQPKFIAPADSTSYGAKNFIPVSPSGQNVASITPVLRAKAKASPTGTVSYDKAKLEVMKKYGLTPAQYQQLLQAALKRKALGSGDIFVGHTDDVEDLTGDNIILKMAKKVVSPGSKAMAKKTAKVTGEAVVGGAATGGAYYAVDKLATDHPDDAHQDAADPAPPADAATSPETANQSVTDLITDKLKDRIDDFSHVTNDIEEADDQRVMVVGPGFVGKHGVVVNSDNGTGAQLFSLGERIRSNWGRAFFTYVPHSLEGDADSGLEGDGDKPVRKAIPPAIGYTKSGSLKTYSSMSDVFHNHYIASDLISASTLDMIPESMAYLADHPERHLFKEEILQYVNALLNPGNYRWCYKIAGRFTLPTHWKISIPVLRSGSFTFPVSYSSLSSKPSKGFIALSGDMNDLTEYDEPLDAIGDLLLGSPTPHNQLRIGPHTEFRYKPEVKEHPHKTVDPAQSSTTPPGKKYLKAAAGTATVGALGGAGYAAYKYFDKDGNPTNDPLAAESHNTAFNPWLLTKDDAVFSDNLSNGLTVIPFNGDTLTGRIPVFSKKKKKAVLQKMNSAFVVADKVEHPKMLVMSPTQGPQLVAPSDVQTKDLSDAKPYDEEDDNSPDVEANEEQQ